MVDLYKILQIDPEAEDEVVQAAYRRLARKYHPDVATGTEAEERMAAINAAWHVLRDPARRSAYDRVRAARAARSHPSHQPHPSDGSAEQGTTPASPGASSHQPARPHPRPSSHSKRPPDSEAAAFPSGRSSSGSSYDQSMRSPDGYGAAGPPPGHASGSILNFGRFAGWSLGEIERVDLEYLEWLERTPIGRPYRDEVDAILRRHGRRRSASVEASERRGLFRRR